MPTKKEILEANARRLREAAANAGAGDVNAYITAKLAEARARALQKSRNRTMPAFVSTRNWKDKSGVMDSARILAGDKGFDIDKAMNMAYAYARYAKNPSELVYPHGFNMSEALNENGEPYIPVAPASFLKAAAEEFRAAKQFSDEREAILADPEEYVSALNCIATATDNYGAPYVQTDNRRFASDPKGFIRVPVEDALPGDIVQASNKSFVDGAVDKYEEGWPSHGMILEDPSDEYGLPTFNYSSGQYNPYALRRNAHYSQDPLSDDIYNAYRFVGTPADSLRWKQEYEQLNKFYRGGKKRNKENEAVAAAIREELAKQDINRNELGLPIEKPLENEDYLLGIGALGAAGLANGAASGITGAGIANAINTAGEMAMPSSLIRGAAYYLPSVAGEAAAISPYLDAAALSYWSARGMNNAAERWKSGDKVGAVAEGAIASMPIWASIPTAARTVKAAYDKNIAELSDALDFNPFAYDAAVSGNELSEWENLMQHGQENLNLLNRFYAISGRAGNIRGYDPNRRALYHTMPQRFQRARAGIYGEYANAARDAGVPLQEFMTYPEAERSIPNLREITGMLRHSLSGIRNADNWERLSRMRNNALNVETARNILRQNFRGLDSIMEYELSGLSDRQLGDIISGRLPQNASNEVYRLLHDHREEFIQAAGTESLRRHEAFQPLEDDGFGYDINDVLSLLPNAQNTSSIAENAEASVSSSSQNIEDLLSSVGRIEDLSDEALERGINNVRSVARSMQGLDDDAAANVRDMLNRLEAESNARTSLRMHHSIQSLESSLSDGNLADAREIYRGLNENIARGKSDSEIDFDLFSRYPERFASGDMRKEIEESLADFVSNNPEGALEQYLSRIPYEIEVLPVSGAPNESEAGFLRLAYDKGLLSQDDYKEASKLLKQYMQDVPSDKRADYRLSKEQFNEVYRNLKPISFIDRRSVKDGVSAFSDGQKTYFDELGKALTNYYNQKGIKIDFTKINSPEEFANEIQHGIRQNHIVGADFALPLDIGNMSYRSLGDKRAEYLIDKFFHDFSNPDLPYRGVSMLPRLSTSADSKRLQYVFSAKNYGQNPGQVTWALSPFTDHGNGLERNSVYIDNNDGRVVFTDPKVARKAEKAGLTTKFTRKEIEILNNVKSDGFLHPEVERPVVEKAKKLIDFVGEQVTDALNPHLSRIAEQDALLDIDRMRIDIPTYSPDNIYWLNRLMIPESHSYSDGLRGYRAVYEAPSPLITRHAEGGEIHIKPENRGKFTALKERTGHSATWFKEHGTPAQVKMATFALNAAKWHGDGGMLEFVRKLKEQKENG